MEVIVKPDPESACRLAAHLVARLVRRRPAVLGLATGATFVPVYAELVRLHREEGLSFGETTTFNLDEYVGLDPENPRSFRRYMAEHLFDHVDLPPGRVHVPDGTAPDVALACQSFEEEIVRAGGIDLQLLGIGVDGHIGFNEPSSSLASRTRIKTLTARTLAANFGAPDADERPPRHVLTMGIATILEARRCVLLAWGEKKAEAVARAVEGPLTAFVPASALQLHRQATVIVDEAAAGRLALREYYRDTYAAKPDWQREE